MLLPAVTLALGSCATTPNFPFSVLDWPNDAVSVESVSLEGRNVQATLTFTNKTGSVVCYRKYEDGRGGSFSPFVIFDNKFDPPAPSTAGIPVPSPYSIEKLEVGQSEQFAALGYYKGSPSDLIERGSFVAIFLGADCEGKEIPTRFRSKVHTFREYLSAPTA